MNPLWTRRDFINTVGVATASMAAACGGGGTGGTKQAPNTNKRETLLDLLDAGKKQTYIPAAFFLHFDEVYHRGPGAIEKHLEFFRYTGMDFVKIQYEITFPPLPEIKTPADWAKMPLYKDDFYEPQLKVVEGLVKEAKGSVQAPKSVDIVDTIPCSALGKPDKKELRKQFWGDKKRGVN